MARKGFNRHNTVVTGSDDAGKQVSLDAWNEDLDKRGMLGFAPTEPNIPIISGSLAVTDTWTVVDAEGAPTTDTLDNITTGDTATEDIVMLVADTSQVITLTHQAGGAGQVHLLGGIDLILDENVPVLLIRSGTDWYEFGGSSGSGGSQTPWTSDIDAVGFSLINANQLFSEQTFVTFTSGAIADGDERAGIQVSVDETLSTGGDIFGLGVLSSSLGSSSVYGLGVGVEVNPILQQTGTFGDLDSILEEANDVTIALSGGAGNITAFSVNGDTMTYGDVAKFQELEILLDTPASGAGVKPTFEFSTGVGTWASFEPLDGTDGYRQSGVILWDSVDIPSWAVGTGGEFLIRVTRTQNTINTDPILDLIQRSAVTTYTWDKAGDLSINNLTVAGGIVLDLSTSGTDIDFDEGELQEISISANTTFTGINYAIGKSKTVKITTDGTLRTLDFPPNWTFVGLKPIDQAANKVGILTLTSYTVLNTGVVCAYAVEA